MKKRYIIIGIIIIFLLTFLFIYYKFKYNGNTINNKNDIVEIFSKKYKKYNASIEVKVVSNKNENIYKIEQTEDETSSKLQVIEGNNAKGTEIELKEGILKLRNTKLNLEKKIENYNCFSNNNLFLSTFIKDYSNEENNKQINEDEENFVINIEFANNTYIKNKQLYINKKNLKPVKLIINSLDNKEITSIIYTNIEIN